MKKWLALTAIAVLSGCVSQVPFKRPMQETYKPVLKDVQVHTYASQDGVGVRYFLQDSSAAGAPYGLLGALVASALDGMMNVGPREQSAKLANTLATQFDLKETELALQQKLSMALNAVPGLTLAGDIKHAPADQRLEPGQVAGRSELMVAIRYEMSPDLLHLNIISDVSLLSNDMQYQPLYPEEAEELARAEKNRLAVIEKNNKKTTKKPAEVPVDQRRQLYRNQFTFVSDAMQVEPVSQEVVDAKVLEIKERYQDSKGKLTKDREKLKKMNREISAAKEPEHPLQTAERRAQKWIANDGELLKQALLTGVSDISNLLARDLQETEIPDFNAKTADEIETSADGDRRVVKRSAGWFAGQYVSEPVNVQFQMWNAINHGDPAAAASAEE